MRAPATEQDPSVIQALQNSDSSSCPRGFVVSDTAQNVAAKDCMVTGVKFTNEVTCSLIIGGICMKAATISFFH